MNAEELDKLFDDGGETLQCFDIKSIRHPGLETVLKVLPCSRFAPQPPEGFDHS